MIVKWFLALFLLMLFNYGIQAQVAPGVPPQRYQQGAPPQQQQYQQHVPQQQVPVQTPQQFQQQPPQQQFQQQPPQQQFQQPPPQHGLPQPGGHGHGHAHGAPQQILHSGNIQHEKEHIAEHMEVPIDTSKMSEQELQFHYFKMHDADNNNKLDGCELIKSLIHWHEQGNKDPNNPNKIEEKVFKNEELTELIDPILKMDDINNDGYIDYPEFIRAQQKAVQQNQPRGQQ